MAETLSSLADLKGSELAPASAEAPVHVQKLDKLGRAYATGKRKNAVARVWIRPGRASRRSTASRSTSISQGPFCA